MAKVFLSTLPVRGATARSGRRRPLRPISIHAPREGSDRRLVMMTCKATIFLSTLPVRGATFHPLLLIRSGSHFYPRSP